MKNKYKINGVILENEDIETQAISKEKVCFTCPKCGENNTHFWFKKENHLCNECGHEVNYKFLTMK